MGYCVMPYRVNFPRLQAVRGSRNQSLLEQLRPLAQQGSEEEEDDEFEDEDDDYEDEQDGDGERDDDGPTAGRVTVEEALERFINGETLSGNPVHYAEVLWLIIDHTETALDNSAVAPAAPQHFTYVDTAFRNNGIGDAVSMLSLIFGGPPVDLPSWEDFPQVGHMTPEAVRKARGRIAPKDWSSHPREAQDTIALVDRWIEEAAAEGEGLVCFYS